jgi:alpha-beta hydrolase superfamily lysophospholipase
MTLWLVGAIAVLGAGFIAWQRATRREATATFDPTLIGDDPETYLAWREAKIAAIKPGQHKQIVWAHPQAKSKTPYSIVYIHGFSASPGELRPVPDLVARRLGANLYFTRLDGHGEAAESLGRAKVQSWIDDVAEAIAIGERIGEKVIVMATSTGGALTTWALAQPKLSKKIAAAVLLSPNYGLQAAGAFLLAGPFGRQLARLVIGPTRGFEPTNESHATFWTSVYPTDALIPMAHSVALANRAPLETITTPALFLYSPKDQTVDPNKTLRNADRWGGPHTLIAVEHTEDQTGHVLAGDALSPSTTQDVALKIGDWLETTLSLKAPQNLLHSGPLRASARS